MPAPESLYTNRLRAESKLLDIISDQGACMQDPDANMTPSKPPKGTTTPEGTKRYKEQLHKAMAYCGSCPVAMECAVYSNAVGAPPVNGRNVLSPEDRKLATLNEADFANYVSGLEEPAADID